MPLAAFQKWRKIISTPFTAADCLKSRIFVTVGFIVRPSDLDAGQDVSDSGDEDNAPAIEISEYACSAKRQ